MNFRIYLLALVAGLSALLNFSCASKDDSFTGTEVVFDDGYRTTENGEIIIDDSSFGQISSSSSAHIARQEKRLVLKDDSVLAVMYDGFGNKIETREFPKDARLLLLTVKTFANGKQEVAVRGRSGELKTLPSEMFSRALTTDANEIANLAGITEIQRETSAPPAVVAMQTEQPKQTYPPMPQAPQYTQEVAGKENLPEEPQPSPTEQKPIEKKVEKTEEKSQKQQDSLQKDLNQPVFTKRKDNLD